MLAIVWVVQIGSITRTSACITARSTFSCADAASGSSRATSANKTRTIILSPRTEAHTLCDAPRMYTPQRVPGRDGTANSLPDQRFRPKSLKFRAPISLFPSRLPSSLRQGGEKKCEAKSDYANTYYGHWPRFFGPQIKH